MYVHVDENMGTRVGVCKWGHEQESVCLWKGVVIDMTTCHT
jgi:hypothetical protein